MTKNTKSGVQVTAPKLATPLRVTFHRMMDKHYVIDTNEDTVSLVDLVAAVNRLAEVERERDAAIADALAEGNRANAAEAVARDMAEALRAINNLADEPASEARAECICDIAESTLAAWDALNGGGK